jgi:hypothetical protein
LGIKYNYIKVTTSKHKMMARSLSKKPLVLQRPT